MSKQRQPIDLIIAKDRKHLTKAEIESRRKSEVKTTDGEIIPPKYLTKKQKDEFNDISEKLQKLRIMNETDVDTLARYVVANTFYVAAVKKMRTREVSSDPELFETWLKIQERMYKQCRSCANDMGLTISSRCRLVVPDAGGKEEKENKFRKFEKRPTA